MRQVLGWVGALQLRALLGIDTAQYSCSKTRALFLGRNEKM